MLTEDYRSVVRLALGTTGVFTLGLFFGWSMAVIGAVFTTLFLQAPGPMPPKVLAKLFTFALLVMIVSWILASLLVPYPIVFLAVVCIGVIMSFAWTLKGAGVLPGVLALMAAMMIPNVVLQSSDQALVLVGWIPINLLIAGFVSTLMFLLIPSTAPVATKVARPIEQDFDKNRRLFRMSLVTVPFALVFFISGSSALLVLFFVALLSQQLVAMSGAGKNVGMAMVLSNTLGAFIAIICFEINVIAPSILTTALLCLLFCLALGALGKSDSKLAPAAGSAITTVLIIYGGSIGPLADEPDATSITRVVQIASAIFFVIIAYIVVDEFWPERKRPEV